MKRCIVIGSMPVDFDLKSILKPDDFIFCADGGYVHAQKQGVVPDVIVGDFDSSEQPSYTSAKVIKLPCEKDDTDTYYIARQIVAEGYTHAIFCGVTGGRLTGTYDFVTDCYPAAQIIPVGICVGRKVFGFAEVGYGTMYVGGMIGVGYSF